MSEYPHTGHEVITVITKKESDRIRRLENRQNGIEYQKIGYNVANAFAGSMVLFSSFVESSINRGTYSLTKPTDVVESVIVAGCLVSAFAFRRWGISQAENPTTISISKS